jgi:hypothetical protein
MSKKKETEIWKQIKNNTMYEISNFGKVKNTKTSNILKPIYEQRKNHAYVNMNKKKYTISKLVAEYFIKNDDPINKTELEYINGNNKNIRYDNLIWKKKITKGKRTRKQTKGAIQLYDESNKLIREWVEMNEILDNTNHTYSHLIKCLNGTNKLAYGHMWKYKSFQKKNIVVETDEVFKNIGIIKGRDFSNYEISNYGKVRNKTTKKYLEPIEQVNYLLVTIYDTAIKQKNYVIHKLVAVLFLEKKNNNAIEHLDGNLKNNYYKNLKWIKIEQKQIVINNDNNFFNIDHIINNEKWINITGYLTYQISNHGRVKNFKTNRILKPVITESVQESPQL